MAQFWTDHHLDMFITASTLNPKSKNWPESVSALSNLVDEEQRNLLLPPQFVLAALPSIGGRILQWSQEGNPVAVGYSLPARGENGTLYHQVSYIPVSKENLNRIDKETLKTAFLQQSSGEEVRLFDVSNAERWSDPPPLESVADITYAQPRAQDAHTLRQLQSLVWQARTENLYPAFLHHPNCEAAWSLVARKGDRVVGFLLGFWHGKETPYSLSDWKTPNYERRVFESQALGIDPDFRKLNIAYHLKRIQAQELRKNGTTHVQWTADPLQYSNSSLNCNRLGAVGSKLLPDYLPFRNALNRVPASRLRLVWPLNAIPVQQALTQGRASNSMDLNAETGLPQVHINLQQVRLGLDAPQLAIEIPANWTHLQKTDLAASQAWREVTDDILTQYLGPKPGQYVVNQTGHTGEKRFLIVTRIGSALLSTYGL